MPAIVVAGAIAGAGAIGAAAIGASAQNKASKAATQAAQNATDQNIALQTRVREENKGILSPYVNVGTQATPALNALMYGNDNGASLAALQKAPGYQFRMDEGNRSLNTGWAARGLLNSGAAQKAILKYGQDYASNEYGNRFNQLAQQQGVGLSAGNALAGVGTNFANSVSSQNNALASAQANSALAQGQANANIWGTAANALGQVGGSFISSYKPPQPQNWLSGVGGTRYNMGY